MQILHFSDVHVQVDYRQIGYANLDWRRLLAQLEMDWMGRARAYVQAPRVIDEIGGAARRTGADHLVLSGDLTGLAFDAEFAAAREALEPMAKPELLTASHRRASATRCSKSTSATCCAATSPSTAPRARTRSCGCLRTRWLW
jgi:3',5'-cyclic AMP phosphodiesterase CpdA